MMGAGCGVRGKRQGDKARGRQGESKKVSGATLRRELPMMIEFTVKDKFFIVPILYSFSGGRGCSCSGFSGVSTAVPSGFLLAARRREMRFA